MEELIVELNRFKKLSGLNNLVEMQSKLNQYDVNGHKTGYWEEYDDDGNLDSKGEYINGLKNGYWEYYNTNGGLMYKGNYINGEEEGYWDFFYDNGQLESKALYKNGEVINRFLTKEKRKTIDNQLNQPESDDTINPEQTNDKKLKKPYNPDEYSFRRTQM